MDRSDVGRRCSRRSDVGNVLQTFKPKGNIAYEMHANGVIYQTVTLTEENRKDAILARDECEKWCHDHESCFACSTECGTDENTCTWNALKQCGAWQFWDGIINGDISVKIGKTLSRE